MKNSTNHDIPTAKKLRREKRKKERKVLRRLRLKQLKEDEKKAMDEEA
jgi:hypothetical protein